MGSIKNLTGMTFGYLTVVKPISLNATNKVSYFKCLCICGKHKIVLGANLSAGRIKSCGCKHYGHTFTHGFKRGGKNPKEYNTWVLMKQRCNNINDIGYHNYGGRGIKVSKEWEKSFITFFKDMGLSPSPSHSIERIDNNKGYCKNNCKWATRKEQNRNKRTTVWITYKGSKMTQKEFANHIGGCRASIRKYLKTKTVQEIVNYYKKRKNNNQPFL